MTKLERKIGQQTLEIDDHQLPLCRLAADRVLQLRHRKTYEESAHTVHGEHDLMARQCEKPGLTLQHILEERQHARVAGLG